MALARLLLKVAVALVVLAIVAVATAYAIDMKVQASVVDKSCNPLGESTVTVRAKVLGVTHTAPVDTEVCATLQPDNFVEYRLRSGRTSLYEAEGGRCLFDTEHGLGPDSCAR
ncbi:MAG: hypothetical protein QOD77_1986 [Thermoplasmata archaeon]|nr:hypothetical protein [Thermoplasmata archaeon]